jgi:chromosome segregation ATPase
VAKLDQEIGGLFELPPEEFTAARNELSRRLKDEGDAAAAAGVKQLGKPTVAAWTVNQLARQEKAALRKLLAAGAKLRQAQEQALRSPAAAGNALRQAQQGERDALRGLTHAAQEILEDAGRPASRSVLDQISSTLRAAAVSDEGRAALEAGRFSGELKPSGFDALAGLDLGARSSRRRPEPARDELAARRREKQEREQRRRELRERARKLDAAASEAEREADRAESAATKARAAAEQSRRKAESAARELDELEP